MSLSKRLIPDWRPETQSLIDRLRRAGFTLAEVSDGEERKEVISDADTLDHVTACDYGWLYFDRDGERLGVWLVFGNNPGELPSDYTWSETEAGRAFHKALGEHSDEWETKGQPSVWLVSGFEGEGEGERWVYERYATRTEADARCGR